MKKILGLLFIIVLLASCKPKPQGSIDKMQSGFRYETIDTSSFDEEIFDDTLVFGDYTFALPITLEQFYDMGYAYYYIPQSGGKGTDDAIVKPGEKLAVRFARAESSDEIVLEIENASEFDATITQCIKEGHFIIQDELAYFALRGVKNPIVPEEQDSYYDSFISKMGQPSELWFTTDKKEGYGYVYDYGDYILVFNFFESPKSGSFTYRGLVYIPHGMWASYAKQFPDGILQ